MVITCSSKPFFCPKRWSHCPHKYFLSLWCTVEKCLFNLLLSPKRLWQKSHGKFFTLRCTVDLWCFKPLTRLKDLPHLPQTVSWDTVVASPVCSLERAVKDLCEPQRSSCASWSRSLSRARGSCPASEALPSSGSRVPSRASEDSPRTVLRYSSRWPGSLFPSETVDSSAIDSP